MKSHCAGVAIVILLAIQSLGFIVTAPESLFNRHSDLLAQHLATQTVLHQVWQRGDGIPLWRDDQLSGAPAFTNPQATFSHPLHFPFALFDPARVVGLVIWLEMVLAAIGAYLAAAALNLSLAGRVMTAASALWSFKTILAVYAGWLPVVAAVAAVPFVFAATLMVFRRASLASAIGLGLAGALALHAGHPQVTYYAFVFVTGWCLVHLARHARINVAAAGRTMAVLGGGAAIAIGLSAYRLLPIGADLPLVTRSNATTEFFSGVGLLPAAGLLTVAFPEYFGTPLNDSYPEGWEYILYIGGVPTLLAAFAFTTRRPGPHVVALRIAVVLSALLAIDSPLLRLVAAVVPGYGLLRMPARVLFLTSFFGCCLAGVGLDDLLSKTRRERRHLVGLLLVALVAIEGTYWSRRYLRATDSVPFPVAAEYVGALRTSEPARLVSLSRSTPDYGSASALGLQIVNGYDPFIFSHYQTYLDLVQLGRSGGPRSTVWADLETITRWDLLDALNVAFVVSPAPLPVSPPGYVLTHRFDAQLQFSFYAGIGRGPVYVYRNEHRLKRAYFASSVRTAADEDGMVNGVIRANLRDEAIVLGPGGPSAGEAEDKVDVIRAAGGVVELNTQSTRRRFLVVSEVWHPGWRATVDGEPAPLFQANIALQGLWLDPGLHHVHLRFWPTGLSAGLWVTGASVVGLLVCVVLMLRRPRP